MVQTNRRTRQSGHTSPANPLTGRVSCRTTPSLTSPGEEHRRPGRRGHRPRVPGRRGRQQPAGGKLRQHALAEPVRLLQVRVPRQDEVVDAQRVILLDPVRDLAVAADQRRTRAAADQADARPQVRRDLQLVPLPAVQRQHPLLAHRFAAAQRLLGGRHGVRVEVAKQPVGRRPRLRRRVPGDHVQPDAEPDGTPLGPGQAADPVDLLLHLLGRLAPGQIDIAVPGGHRTGGGRRPTEEDLRQRVGRQRGQAAPHVEVLALEVERPALPRPPEHREELVGARVPAVVVQMVAEPLLLGGVTAGHHIEHQPAPGEPLVRRRHLRRKHRGDQPRPEGHQELQPLGVLRQRRRHHPGVLAPRAGRRQHPSKPNWSAARAICAR